VESGDMNENDKPERKVINLVHRSLVKTIDGRQMRFVEPGVGAESGLDEIFRAGDVSAYVSALIAVCVAEPELTAEGAAVLPERARARARVAVAEVMDVAEDYKRLVGSGDERLHRAIEIRNERLAAELKAVGAVINDNVVRMVQDAQRTLSQLAGSDAVARIAEGATQAQRIVASLPINDMVAQANRIVEQMRPAFDWVEQNRRLFADIADSQQRFAEAIARSIEPVIRPSYFGALADIQRQVDIARPRYADEIATTLAAITEAVVPRVDWIMSLARVELPPVLMKITETVESIQRAIGPDVARLLNSMGEGVRRALAEGAAAYASWLERHWPEVYANTEHPPPVLFLIASLPMSIGLPLYQAVERTKRDEELLDGLERALQSSALLDQIEAAVQTSVELDPIAKRRLVVALESVRVGHYIDAAPDLYQGLERAFYTVARKRKIIDDNNKFFVAIRTRRVTSRICSSISDSIRLTGVT
jgi:hypothetical protein